MFISKLDVCKTTGICSYEIKWNIGAGDRMDRGAFTAREDALKYIDSSKRSYILLLYEKYVLHSKVLHETGHHDFYKTKDKLSSLDRCIKYLHWFQDKKLDEVCTVILKLQDDLRRILPAPANPSRSSSESRLLDMIVFSKEQTKHLSSINLTKLSA